MEDCLDKSLDPKVFTTIADSPPSTSVHKALNATSAVTSVRSTKSGWAQRSKTQHEKLHHTAKGPWQLDTGGISKGPPLIVFIMGAMTHSEMRVAYEVSQQRACDVIVGSHGVITPDGMVNALYGLGKSLDDDTRLSM